VAVARAPSRGSRRPLTEPGLEDATPLPSQPAAAPDDDAPGSLHPVGPEAGYLLLRLLSLNGWTITVRSCFAGHGVLLQAQLGDIVVFQQGNTVGEIACEVVKEATRRQHEQRRAGSTRLRDAA
jgi:hypothetical protein